MSGVEAGNAGRLWKLEKSRKQIPFHPEASRKECSPADTLTIPVRPRSDFWWTKLQGKMNAYHSKPLIVWQLIVEATRKLIQYLYIFLN